MNESFLSVVIPTFNEQNRIVQTLDQLLFYFSSKDYSWEIVVSDDGSTDLTVKLIEEWAQKYSNIHIVLLPHKGKGWAVKNGMLQSSGKYRLMFDADMAMHPNEIDKFLDRIQNDCDVVIGSRNLKGSFKKNEPFLRKVMGRVFNLFVQIFAVYGYFDTQCGYKCFTSKSAEQLFGMQKIWGWGFDVEILMLCKKYQLNVKEIPINWDHQLDSKVKVFNSTISIIKEVLLTRFRILSNKYN